MTFAPECLVPVGDTAVPMCWLCAHHVVEHGTPLNDAPEAECDCMPQDIYPHRAHEPPGTLMSGELEPEPVVLTDRERSVQELLKDATIGDKAAQWIRVAHAQLSKGQHEAIRKKLERTIKRGN
jgi:hypothetical protein